MLLHDSLRPVTVGLTIGVFVAVLGARVLAGILYGVSTADPIAFVALLVLLSAATLAVTVPTRGAAASIRLQSCDNSDHAPLLGPIFGSCVPGQRV